MGSLMPGWDSAFPGLPPKDLQDAPDTDEVLREGYFAKYTRMKSLRSRHEHRDAEDQDRAARLTDTLDLARQISATPDADQGTRRLLSTVSMPAPHMRIQAVQATDSLRIQRTQSGKSESGSPRVASPQSPTLGSSKDTMSRSWGGVEKKRADDLYAPPTWWKKFSSAHLNEVPEASDPAQARGSPYIPQHTVAGGKLQYIATATTAAGPSTEGLQ